MRIGSKLTDGTPTELSNLIDQTRFGGLGRSREEEKNKKFLESQISLGFRVP